MNHVTRLVAATVLALQFVMPAFAQELRFATAKEAQRILAIKDDFIERLSPFDRAARVKTDRDVSEPQFLRFIASASRDWEPYERHRIAAAFQAIRSELNRLSLPLPETIYMIKTSGAEEGRAAYTRQNAIIIPENMLQSSDRETRRMLAHELFHISSRANPKLAGALYEAIGFRVCGEAPFPAGLASRKITNPDAPKNDHCIRLKVNGQDVWAVPILFSRTPRYDTLRRGEFFEYLQMALLLVEGPAPSGVPRVLNGPQGPRLVTLREVVGFFEQVGRNTNYVLHPEEILAENFALLVLRDQNVRSPEILTKIRNTLTEWSVAAHEGRWNLVHVAGNPGAGVPAHRGQKGGNSHIMM